jgi:hypothetical protein
MDRTVRSRKMPGQRSVNAWVSEVLREGAIGAVEWNNEGLQIDKETAYRHYFEWGKNRREYRTRAKNSWVREIKRIFGPVVDAEYREVRNDRRYLKFATLETCRAAFRTYAETAGAP